jgi:hypothetical protein
MRSVERDSGGYGGGREESSRDSAPAREERGQSRAREATRFE